MPHDRDNISKTKRLSYKHASMTYDDDLQKYEAYYDEEKFLVKLKKLFLKLGEEVAIRALMLWLLLVSGETPIKIRLLIVAALGYFVMPADLVSDFIPVLGFTDDVAFLTYAFNQASRYMDDSMRKKAEEKLKSWMASGKINRESEA
jgi:uncharacterized membrane protein YkvA (DUF1232 family)